MTDLHYNTIPTSIRMRMVAIVDGCRLGLTRIDVKEKKNKEAQITVYILNTQKIPLKSMTQK